MTLRFRLAVKFRSRLIAREFRAVTDSLNRWLFCSLVFAFVRGVTVCVRTRLLAMFGCIRVLLTAACVLAAVVACTLDVVRGFLLVSTFAVP
jgi:hypothetical protein